MPKVTCTVCGRLVTTTASNYIYANGIHQHKKCPRSAILAPEEINDYKELTDAIKWACVKYDKPANWRLITAQIKRFKDELGYTYKDQFLTLKYVVDKDGTFWGFGRIEKFFAHAKEHKRKLEEFEAKRIATDFIEKKVELKVISKPAFLDM